MKSKFLSLSILLASQTFFINGCGKEECDCGNSNNDRAKFIGNYHVYDSFSTSSSNYVDSYDISIVALGDDNQIILQNIRNQAHSDTGSVNGSLATFASTYANSWRYHVTTASFNASDKLEINIRRDWGGSFVPNTAIGTKF